MKRLVWGGGMRIEHSLWPEWDGECETFDIHDLTGIQLLPNLEDVRFISAMAATDLAPLAELPRLKALKLPVVPRSDAVIKTLKERGVAIS